MDSDSTLNKKNRYNVLSVALVISIIVAIGSGIFLCVAISHAKKPLTYCIALPEPPEGATLPETYEIVIPAVGNKSDCVSFGFEQDVRSTSVISMNCDVEVKDTRK